MPMYLGIQCVQYAYAIAISRCAEVLRGELGGTNAWREYDEHVNAVFSRYLSANEKDE
ncbi:MAG: hypothetical protein IJI68_04490 [Eggerthellaceae bacterium]|nr:hypothetical protein [Eggerthellaceae bacterium]